MCVSITVCNINKLKSDLMKFKVIVRLSDNDDQEGGKGATGSYPDKF